jgi:hypothetical protein
MIPPLGNKTKSLKVSKGVNKNLVSHFNLLAIIAMKKSLSHSVVA